MFYNSCYFLTYIYFKRDSYMIFLDVRPPQSAEDRRETAVAHLALARSLNCRNRHFG